MIPSWAWSGLIGLSLILFPPYPTISSLLLILVLAAFVTIEWDRVKQMGLGPRCLCIPLFVIAFAIRLSGDNELFNGWVYTGFIFFGLYLAGRTLGKAILLPFSVIAIIGSSGILWSTIQQPGTVTGGLLFQTNYNLAIGYILLGAFVFINKWRWIVVTLALVATLLSGSPEAVLPIIALGAAIFWRKDWSKKLALCGAAIALTVISLAVTGHIKNIYAYGTQIANGQATAQDKGMEDTTLAWRLRFWEEAVQNITPLGSGFTVTNISAESAHNVPLIIVQQLGWLGIAAALAWLWVSVYCLRKSTWKYTWLILLSLSVWDHFIWSTLAPFWWAIVGASTVSTNSDYIFRTAHDR